ncbi:DMT family transporter [Paracoccus sp. p3-h83]
MVQHKLTGARAAALFILIYAVVIGFTDNFVRVIAADVGLWQFHAMRSVMALALVAAYGAITGLGLRPLRPRAVAARSVVHATAMLLYFAGLGFLPVPQVAAGLFTAPIFVLLLSRLIYGHRIGWLSVAAVAIGFLGILLVLRPGSQAPISWVAALPVAAGFFYALGNLATREWCAGESAEVMTAGFFVAIGLMGLLGTIVFTLWPQGGGSDPGFLLRGVQAPNGVTLWWTFVQAAGSLFAVTMMVKGYQATAASRASVFEYILLPVTAAWGSVLWGEVPGLVAVAGMGLIVLAGALIVSRSEG